jgi:hypothetical protein
MWRACCVEGVVHEKVGHAKLVVANAVEKVVSRKLFLA